MPENQSQPNLSGDPASATGGARTTPQPDLKQQEARPSDAELAHAPEEGRAVRDPRQEAPEVRHRYADQNRGSLDGRTGKDLGQEARAGERLGQRGGRLDG